MADNYLEKKMEELHNRKAGCAPTRVSPASRHLLTLPFKPLRVLVIARDRHAVSQYIKPFQNAGCRVAVVSTSDAAETDLPQNHGCRYYVIGNDEQLQKFATSIAQDIYPEDLEIEKREMKLRQLIISSKSEFCGKSLIESGIRDKYNCMVVGLEEGQENLTKIAPSYVFQKGDILWIVGEESDLQKIMEKS